VLALHDPILGYSTNLLGVEILVSDRPQELRDELAGG
jgi:hypothetical protein